MIEPVSLLEHMEDDEETNAILARWSWSTVYAAVCKVSSLLSWPLPLSSATQRPPGVSRTPTYVQMYGKVFAKSPGAMACKCSETSCCAKALIPGPIDINVFCDPSSAPSLRKYIHGLDGYFTHDEALHVWRPSIPTLPSNHVYLP